MTHLANEAITWQSIKLMKWPWIGDVWWWMTKQMRAAGFALRFCVSQSGWPCVIWTTEPAPTGWWLRCLAAGLLRAPTREQVCWRRLRFQKLRGITRAQKIGTEGVCGRQMTKCCSRYSRWTHLLLSGIKQRFRRTRHKCQFSHSSDFSWVK